MAVSIGKSPINGPFPIDIFDYRRVYKVTHLCLNIGKHQRMIDHWVWRGCDTVKQNQLVSPKEHQTLLEWSWCSDETENDLLQCTHISSVHETRPEHIFCWDRHRREPRSPIGSCYTKLSHITSRIRWKFLQKLRANWKDAARQWLTWLEVVAKIPIEYFQVVRTKDIAYEPPTPPHGRYQTC